MYLQEWRLINLTQPCVIHCGNPEPPFDLRVVRILEAIDGELECSLTGLRLIEALCQLQDLELGVVGAERGSLETGESGAGGGGREEHMGGGT